MYKERLLFLRNINYYLLHIRELYIIIFINNIVIVNTFITDYYRTILININAWKGVFVLYFKLGYLYILLIYNKNAINQFSRCLLFFLYEKKRNNKISLYFRNIL
ncbi:hypothetical protein PFFVO_03125 [Plasmodium falciparum Vietnam Oak-Knoll (FVO)]|uniref:Uncharacterized protein n=1 Tax=Plasmodium falciparum Vietnam Oak-Knoll (FVO) TaxID=1036723 RepID=A0A024V6Q1_PLAFA|nr:hypothetical protein PFFVO_03125 [Plasmodium falciparum Vietnam Oak-Knoll (FVO)]